MADRAEIEAHPSPEQARAMEYVAAAEREAAIIPDIPASTATRKIGKAAIIGAGTMGGGIAIESRQYRHSGDLTRCFTGGA